MRTKIFTGTALVVSRNDAFQHTLHRALSRAGYSIRPVATQQEGLQELRALLPTIVIVDRTESGFAHLQQALPNHTPILTASTHPGPCDESHCALDIEDGAARAVCNASPSVIVALANAVLRRQRWHRTACDSFTAGDVTIDFTNYAVRVGTSTASLTPTQFRILRSLVLAPGHFLSRQALFDRVWGEGFSISPHTLDVTLSSLRRVLHASGAAPDFIVTLKGVGFKLRPSAQAGTIRHILGSPSVSQMPQPAAVPTLVPGGATNILGHRLANWHDRSEGSRSAQYPSTPRVSTVKPFSPSLATNHRTAVDALCERS